MTMRLLCAATLTAMLAALSPAEDNKGTQVELGGMKSTTPADWKEEALPPGSMRMMQFFDTKLKGAPAPDWMVHGIPAKDKGKDQIAKPVITP